MSEHDEHSSFIKTPQQLITIVLLAFIVPIIGIVLLVKLVIDRPTADPAALTPAAIAERIQPVGHVSFTAPAGGEAAPAQAAPATTVAKAGPVDGNSVVIVNDDGVLVVDTHINPAVALPKGTFEYRVAGQQGAPDFPEDQSPEKVDPELFDPAGRGAGPAADQHQDHQYEYAEIIPVPITD